MYGIILLGFATGCRAMTPIAVLCWYMWMGKLPITGLNHWESTMVAVIVFSLAAVGEYVGDTLPSAPSRLSWFPLLSRLVLGSLIGISIASSLEQPMTGGVVFGAGGALVGANGGYWLRMKLARLVGRDLPVALTESALVLALSVFALHGIARDYVLYSVHPYPLPH